MLGRPSILPGNRDFIEEINARSHIIENLEDNILLLGLRITKGVGLDPVVIEGLKTHFDNLLFYCNLL